MKLEHLNYVSIIFRQIRLYFALKFIIRYRTIARVTRRVNIIQWRHLGFLNNFLAIFLQLESITIFFIKKIKKRMKNT